MPAFRDFQVFAKPAGAVCNLACRYCYYLDKDLLSAGGTSRMGDDLLEEYIRQHIEASPGPTVNFSWHGGEPTILGVQYFWKIAAFQEKHRPVGWRITNQMQTNGLLLDEEWAAFLAAERFVVGLSIDGPPDLHDRYRVTKGQQPSHRQVVRAFRLLQRYKIPCDVLCAVHDQNVREPLRVYRFFKDIGARFLGLLPVVAPGANGDGVASPQSVPAEAFGEFLCTVFDEWVRRDIGRIGVQLFDEAARPARGLEHSLCVFRPTCGDIPVVEHNGDFYSCDHYVDAQHRVGTLTCTPLVELLESRPQRSFGEAKLATLPRCCRTCDVRAMCNGGCPKDRFIRAPDGEEGINYLCAAYKRFFTHVLPYTLRLAALERSGESAEPVMASAGVAGPPSATAARRNDPCPCGSGRKYKKCCLDVGSRSLL